MFEKLKSLEGVYSFQEKDQYKLLVIESEDSFIRFYFDEGFADEVSGEKIQSMKNENYEIRRNSYTIEGASFIFFNEDFFDGEEYVSYFHEITYSEDKNILILENKYLPPYTPDEPQIVHQVYYKYGLKSKVVIEFDLNTMTK